MKPEDFLKAKQLEERKSRLEGVLVNFEEGNSIEFYQKDDREAIAKVIKQRIALCQEEFEKL